VNPENVAGELRSTAYSDMAKVDVSNSM
jgi:hypothetical protein